MSPTKVKTVVDPDTRTDEEKKEALHKKSIEKAKVTAASDKKEKEIEAEAKKDKLFKVHIAPKDPPKDKQGRPVAFKGSIKLVKGKSRSEVLKKTENAYKAFQVSDDYKLPKK